MGRQLARSYVYSLIAFALGLILLWASGQNTAGKSIQQIQNETWRAVFYGLAMLLIVVAIAGDMILHLVFEYKLLSL